jgi:hypothetical protein
MLTALQILTDWASALRTQHTLQSNVNCAVKSSAVSKVTQSRNFNCTNVRNFQHTLDLTAQLLTVQLKLRVKLYVCGAPYRVFQFGVFQNVPYNRTSETEITARMDGPNSAVQYQHVDCSWAGSPDINHSSSRDFTSHHEASGFVRTWSVKALGGD